MVHARGKKPPDCEKCMPAQMCHCNKPIFDLHVYCGDQQIVGMNGPVALNMQSVDIAMDHLNITKDERPDFWVGLNMIFRTINNLKVEDQKQRQKQTK